MEVAPATTTWNEAQGAWLAALVRDLEEHRGACLVIAGPEQPPLVHALAHAINAHLDNVGRTVRFTEPVEVEPVNGVQSLRELVEAMAAGQVDTLIWTTQRSTSSPGSVCTVRKRPVNRFVPWVPPCTMTRD